MPQLDFFIFFGLFSSFVVYVVGMFYFSTYVVPFTISVAKLVGARALYYYASINTKTFSSLKMAYCYVYFSSTSYLSSISMFRYIVRINTRRPARIVQPLLLA